MNPIVRRSAIVAAGAVSLLVLVAGCSSKDSGPKTSDSASQTAPQGAAPSGGGEQTMPPGMMMPAGTVAEIWTQVAGEQAKLSTAIENGQLKDVHHLAFGIRDLAVALADKAKAATPGNAAKLEGMVGQVRTSATKLDELGDEGDLSGTQAEYAKLNAVLESLKSISGGK